MTEKLREEKDLNRDVLAGLEKAREQTAAIQEAIDRKDYAAANKASESVVRTLRIDGSARDHKIGSPKPDIQIPFADEPFNGPISPITYKKILDTAILLDHLSPRSRDREKGKDWGGLIVRHGKGPGSYKISYDYDKARDTGRWLPSIGNDLMIYLKREFGGSRPPDDMGDFVSTTQGSLQTGISLKVKEDSNLDMVLKAVADRSQRRDTLRESHL